jgi:hypothetical protein
MFFSQSLNFCFDLHFFCLRICFSITPDFSLFFKKKIVSTGLWNPSITIRSFLTQLYTFLIDDSDRELEARKPVSEYDKQHALNEAKIFRCIRCPHTFDCPYPAISVTDDTPDLYAFDSKSQHHANAPERNVCVVTETGEVKLVMSVPHKSAYEESFSFFTCFFSGKNSDRDLIGFGVRKRYSSRSSLVCFVTLLFLLFLLLFYFLFL